MVLELSIVYETLLYDLLQHTALNSCSCIAFPFWFPVVLPDAVAAPETQPNFCCGQNSLFLHILPLLQSWLQTEKISSCYVVLWTYDQHWWSKLKSTKKWVLQFSCCIFVHTASFIQTLCFLCVLCLCFLNDIFKSFLQTRHVNGSWNCW